MGSLKMLFQLPNVPQCLDGTSYSQTLLLQLHADNVTSAAPAGHWLDEQYTKKSTFLLLNLILLLLYVSPWIVLYCERSLNSTHKLKKLRKLFSLNIFEVDESYWLHLKFFVVLFFYYFICINQDKTKERWDLKKLWSQDKNQTLHIIYLTTTSCSCQIKQTMKIQWKLLH